jgi:hypothetical protein
MVLHRGGKADSASTFPYDRIHWPDLDEDLGIAGMLKGERA